MLNFLLRRGRGAESENADSPPELPASRSEGGAVSVFSSLDEIAPGSRCRVVRLRARGKIRQRLMDLGFVPSATITVVRRAPLNDPIEIRLGDDLVSLRREEAAAIEVARDD